MGLVVPTNEEVTPIRGSLHGTPLSSGLRKIFIINPYEGGKIPLYIHHVFPGASFSRFQHNIISDSLAASVSIQNWYWICFDVVKLTFPLTYVPR